MTLSYSVYRYYGPINVFFDVYYWQKTTFVTLSAISALSARQPCVSNIKHHFSPPPSGPLSLAWCEVPVHNPLLERKIGMETQEQASIKVNWSPFWETRVKFFPGWFDDSSFDQCSFRFSCAVYDIPSLGNPWELPHIRFQSRRDSISAYISILKRIFQSLIGFLTLELEIAIVSLLFLSCKVRWDNFDAAG